MSVGKTHTDLATNGPRIKLMCKEKRTHRRHQRARAQHSERRAVARPTHSSQDYCSSSWRAKPRAGYWRGFGALAVQLRDQQNYCFLLAHTRGISEGWLGAVGRWRGNGRRCVQSAPGCLQPWACWALINIHHVDRECRRPSADRCCCLTSNHTLP
jgi:hypothetical protein